MTQPVTAAPMVESPFGLGAAVGAGVYLPDTDPLDPGNRWKNQYGMAIEGLACRPHVEVDGDLCDPAQSDYARFAALVASQGTLPFKVTTGVSCSTFGQPAGDVLGGFQDAASRHLDLVRWSAIANELWLGTDQPSNRRLASPAATVLSPEPVHIVEAVSLLEDAFSVLVPGGQRIIHTPTRAVTYMDAEGIISAQGTRFYTALRTLVVADDGYPGTGPNGEPAGDGVVWLYGTGPLTARIDKKVTFPEVELADAVVAQENDIYVRAQQYAAITWLCGHLAVPVKLCEN